MGFNKYFTFEELTKTSHAELQILNRKEALQYQISGELLSALLGSIREAYGLPITVTSGFRCLAVNKAVGSKAKSSAHMRFEAADCIPVGKTVQHFFDWLYKNRKEFPWLRKAIIEYHKGIVHIEVKISTGEPQAFYTTNDNVTFKGVA